MAVVTILRGKIWCIFPLKMAAVAMVKVNNAYELVLALDPSSYCVLAVSILDLVPILSNPLFL